jgi:uncharacterized protein YggT (Ycf19 family)
MERPGRAAVGRAALADWIIYGFMGLLILEVIFSWINPDAPLAPFVRALNDPLLRPMRRVIPPVGGIDLSVLVALRSCCRSCCACQAELLQPLARIRSGSRTPLRTSPRSPRA